MEEKILKRIVNRPGGWPIKLRQCLLKAYILYIKPTLKEIYSQYIDVGAYENLHAIDI